MTNFELRYQGHSNASLLDLVDVPPGRALDCGCATGDNARLLRERGWKVTGVTNNSSEIALARASCDDVLLADLNEGLPFADDASYDLVVLSHVLEHLVDPGTLLREMRQILSPGGRIAVALPNIAHYRQRFEFMRGRFEYTETGLLDSTHLRFYTVVTARRLLTDNGYVIARELADGGLPWWRLRRVLPPNLLTRVNSRAVGLLPNLIAGQALFVARPLSVPIPRTRTSTETAPSSGERAPESRDPNTPDAVRIEALRR